MRSRATARIAMDRWATERFTNTHSSARGTCGNSISAPASHLYGLIARSRRTRHQSARTAWFDSRFQMPELPEVETIVRALAPRLTGRHILSVEVLQPRIVRYSKHDIAASATGQRIRRVRRHGKFILVDLDNGLLTIHLGMTGQLLFNTDRSPWTRVVFRLDDSELLYDDPRMFGSIEYSPEE